MATCPECEGTLDGICNECRDKKESTENAALRKEVERQQGVFAMLGVCQKLGDTFGKKAIGKLNQENAALRKENERLKERIAELEAEEEFLRKINVAEVRKFADKIIAEETAALRKENKVLVDKSNRLIDDCNSIARTNLTLRAIISEAVEVVGRIQFDYVTFVDDGGAETGCHFCLSGNNTHTPDCRLAALLEKMKEGK